MSVLMKDVAEKAAVSITTVSHVLNETRPVAANTRARVLKAAAELNYFRNTSARLLVRGQGDLLGLVISDIENPFFPELIKSFEEACTRERLEVVLCATNYDQSQAEKAVRRMLESRVQGVAIMSSQFDGKLLKQLTAHQIPTVLLGSHAARKNRSSIAIDYRVGVSEAVRHLAELGHREVAIISGPRNQVSAGEYQESVLEAMQREGLRPWAIVEGDNRPEGGAAAAASLLRTLGRIPTAILCGNDRMAIGAIGAAAELGFRVPEDISVVGADDVWMARYCYPPLTTVRIPRDRLGQQAFSILLQMIHSKKRAGSQHRLTTELVARRSTGPVSEAKLRTGEMRVRTINMTRANA